jgi:uncharacterized protein DUF4157
MGRTVVGRGVPLPDPLKKSMEQLSGVDLGFVRVHYNSPLAGQQSALDYARGTEIHLAPGQERHLPHEAWHVVQQQQGRVSPTSRSHIGLSNDADTLATERDLLAKRTPLVQA